MLGILEWNRDDRILGSNRDDKNFGLRYRCWKFLGRTVITRILGLTREDKKFGGQLKMTRILGLKIDDKYD